MNTAQPFAERYHIQHKLDQGSFGVVYRASDARLGDRPVALKVIHPQLVVHPESLRLFADEAGILARLRHDHIVAIYDAGLWQGQRYLTMELIEGPSLAQLLEREGAQPADRVIRWLGQAAAALAYAHDRQVLHRDLKPSNLLVEQTTDRLYIADFGLAQAVESSGGSSASQQIQQLTGTATYRAPEVTRTGHTRSSDLYSLGVVAYELLAGRRPFLGDDPLTLLDQHARTPPPPLPKSCPALLAHRVYQLLEKQPESRPADGHKLEAALRTPVVTPPGILFQAEPGEPEAPQEPTTQPTVTKQPWIRYEPGDSPPKFVTPGSFLIGMALLVLMILLLYLALSAGLTR